MNTNLVELDGLCSVVLNNTKDFKVKSCSIGGKKEVTMLEIKGNLNLTKDEKPYYINLAKIIESDINLMRLGGIDLSNKRKLFLNTIQITETKNSSVFVQCTYKDYKNCGLGEFRLLKGQIGEAEIINNIIVVESSFNIDFDYVIFDNY